MKYQGKFIPKHLRFTDIELDRKREPVPANIEIYCFNDKMELIKKFDSISQAAVFGKTTTARIHAAIKNGKKIAKYYWKYKGEMK